MKCLTYHALAALSILTFTTVCFAQDATSTPKPITDKSDPKAVLLAEDNNLDARLPEESTLSAPPKMPLSNSTNKPNIIFIITDDQPPNTIGLAGNGVIKTPNIDSLGQRGVYFKNMYLPIGQCAPSRASIWTGKLPHTHGVVTNGVILPPEQLTLSEILKANGYSTAIIGKCHLGYPTNPEKYKRGFDFRLILYPDTGYVGDWYNYQASRNGVIERQTEYITDFLTSEAITYMTSAASTGQPFFMWVAYTAPHLPITPPHGSNRYTLDQMPVPFSISDNLSSKPPQQTSSSSHQDYLRTARGGDPTAALKSRLKDAYETISNIDDNVGRITRKIQDLGITDNTVVIFMSDNGVFFGEHQLYTKGPFFYEEQIKSPFIFSYPPLTKQAVSSSTLATSIDIMPTILDLIGAPIPQDVQGKSFLNVLSGTSTDHRSSIFMEYSHQVLGSYPMRGVLSDGYKLVHYLSSSVGGERFDDRNFELYDLRADPSEMNNILRRNGPDDNPLNRMLTDPERGRVVQKLRKEMALWQTNTLDPRRVTINNTGIANITSTSAELYWQTARPATSEIEYVEANCLACPPSEITNFDFVTDHLVPLHMLTPNTPYKVRVYSIDSTGNGSYVDTLLTPRHPVPNAQADLAVTQTDMPDPAVAGFRLTYEITVTNQGPHAAQAVELRDTLPEGMQFLSATSSFGNCAGGAVECRIGYMDVGATVKVTISTRPKHLGTNTNIATVSSSETDTDTSNNTAAQDTQVLMGLTRLALSAPITNGCQNLTGTVTLTNPAPDGGTVVTLDDTLAAVTVPDSITVPAGSSGASFPLTITPLSSAPQQNGLIIANLNGRSLSASLVVRPNTVQSLTLSPNPVTGPDSVAGTVTLQCPARAGGMAVGLSSSNPTVAHPTVKSITIPADSRSLSFNVQTSAVSFATTATVYATANGRRQGNVLQVNPQSQSQSRIKNRPANSRRRAGDTVRSSARRRSARSLRGAPRTRL